MANDQNQDDTAPADESGPVDLEPTNDAQTATIEPTLPDTEPVPAVDPPAEEPTPPVDLPATGATDEPQLPDAVADMGETSLPDAQADTANNDGPVDLPMPDSPVDVTGVVDDPFAGIDAPADPGFAPPDDDAYTLAPPMEHPFARRTMRLGADTGDDLFGLSDVPAEHPYFAIPPDIPPMVYGVDGITALTGPNGEVGLSLDRGVVEEMIHDLENGIVPPDVISDDARLLVAGPSPDWHLALNLTTGSINTTIGDGTWIGHMNGAVKAATPDLVGGHAVLHHLPKDATTTTTVATFYAAPIVNDTTTDPYILVSKYEDQSDANSHSDVTLAAGESGGAPAHKVPVQAIFDNNNPADVTDTAAAPGTATVAARRDHKHHVTFPTPTTYTFTNPWLHNVAGTVSHTDAQAATANRTTVAAAVDANGKLTITPYTVDTDAKGHVASTTAGTPVDFDPKVVPGPGGLNMVDVWANITQQPGANGKIFLEGATNRRGRIAGAIFSGYWTHQEADVNGNWSTVAGCTPAQARNEKHMQAVWGGASCGDTWVARFGNPAPPPAAVHADNTDVYYCQLQYGADILQLWEEIGTGKMYLLQGGGVGGNWATLPMQARVLMFFGPSKNAADINA